VALKVWFFNPIILGPTLARKLPARHTLGRIDEKYLKISIAGRRYFAQIAMHISFSEETSFYEGKST
jgi:hypothetical protein